MTMMAELLCSVSDPEWLDLRRTGITATDITVIAGLVGWDSPWCLFWRKRGVLPPVEQTDRMRLGGWLQERIIIEWERKHEFPFLTDTGLLANDDRPWQMATPDAYYPSGPVLEVKTSATRDGWGDDGSSDVPAHVRAQVLWQMDTLGVGTGHVAVCFLPSGEFRSYTIGHESGCNGGKPMTAVSCLTCISIAELREQGHEFWRRLQGELPPPAVDGLAVTTAGLKRLYADPGAHLRAELPAALVESWETLRDNLAHHRADVKQAEQEARQAENAIRDALGQAMLGTDADGNVVIERRFGKRAGYTVPPLETDQLKRTKGASDGDD